jgi:hypothetical protein
VLHQGPPTVDVVPTVENTPQIHRRAHDPGPDPRLNKLPTEARPYSQKGRRFVEFQEPKIGCGSQ